MWEKGVWSLKTVSIASISSAPRQNISTKLQQVKREKEKRTKEGKKSERVKRNIITKKFYAAECGTLRNERDKRRTFYDHRLSKNKRCLVLPVDIMFYDHREA